MIPAKTKHSSVTPYPMEVLFPGDAAQSKEIDPQLYKWARDFLNPLGYRLETQLWSRWQRLIWDGDV
ncbi:MAG: hypothetical protein R2865_06740 [Deinococcales bacterium]